MQSLRLSRKALTRVAITLFISAAGGLVAELLGMPAAWVSGGLLAVAIASLAGVNTDFPRLWTAPVFLVLGIYSGSGVTPGDAAPDADLAGELRHPRACRSSRLIAGSYWWLNIRCGWDRNDALLASLPGALSFVVAAAEDLQAPT